MPSLLICQIIMTLPNRPKYYSKFEGILYLILTFTQFEWRPSLFHQFLLTEILIGLILLFSLYIYILDLALSLAAALINCVPTYIQLVLLLFPSMLLTALVEYSRGHEDIALMLYNHLASFFDTHFQRDLNKIYVIKI